MKIFSMTVVLVVVVFVGFSFAQSGVSVGEWATNTVHTFKKWVASYSSSSTEIVKVSKWVDAKGVTHYENRPVEGAKTLEVDPNKNVLPPAPAIKLSDEKSAKPKTMNEEVQELQKAKDAYYESVINN